MMRGPIVQSIRCIATAMIVLGVMHAANAQISGTTLSASPASFAGDCPTTVTFQGSISGVPGTTFTYTFTWFYGKDFSGDTNATIPPSGSLPVEFAIEVTQSVTNTARLWVRNISTGQPNVYSFEAPYSVACKVNPGVLPSNAHLRNAITLHPQWFALREYEYKNVGPFSSYVPERGSAPCPDLCIGWDHVLDGSFLWLYHWNTFDRAFWGYDPAALTGLKVKKATVTLTIDGGDPACFGGLGRAVLARTPAAKGTTQTFHAPYPDDADFRWVAPVQFTPTTATVDVTAIVQQWASGKMRNDGFVVRGKVEDNGANGNDSCSLRFGRDVVLTIEE